MGIPDHLICLLRDLYADQEATIRTGRGTIDWFQVGKGVHQECILSPHLSPCCSRDSRLLQHHSSEASVLQCSAFFMVQLSHSYMTTGKTIALTIRTFDSNVTAVLFNILYSFVTVFLPRASVF